MTTHHDNGPSPHVRTMDLTPFQGSWVLGEPHDVLLSAVLRMDFQPAGDGMAHFEGVWPQHEMDALLRAMSRVEGEVPEDRRTDGQRDCDRLMAVALRVASAEPLAKRML